MSNELDPVESESAVRRMINEEIDTSISDAVSSVRFGDVLASRGITVVAISEDGVLTRYFPDGTTAPLG